MGNTELQLSPSGGLQLFAQEERVSPLERAHIWWCKQSPDQTGDWSRLPRAPSWKRQCAGHSAGVGDWDSGTIIRLSQAASRRQLLNLCWASPSSTFWPNLHAKQGGPREQHVLFLWLRYLGRSCVSVDRSSEPSAGDWLPEGQLQFTRGSVPSSRGARQCSA